MSFRSAAGLVLTAGIALALMGCSAGEPEPVNTEPVVTTPQASLEGEWVLTRTVTASDDPAREVGAVSERLVFIEQDDCETALCPGTVTSGLTIEERVSTELTQSDGGLSWNFLGATDCLKAGTTTVQVPEAFNYDQTVELTVAESADVEGALTATSLTGTMTYTDTIAEDAADFGCTREPTTTTVEYALSAVRAPTP